MHRLIVVMPPYVCRVGFDLRPLSTPFNPWDMIMLPSHEENLLYMLFMRPEWPDTTLLTLLTSSIPLCTLFLVHLARFAKSSCGEFTRNRRLALVSRDTRLLIRRATSFAGLNQTRGNSIPLINFMARPAGILILIVRNTTLDSVATDSFSKILDKILFGTMQIIVRSWYRNDWPCDHCENEMRDWN